VSANGNARIRVVVVDDEEVFRAVGRSLIEATPEFALVGEADSGEGALERIAELSPDLVLIDYRMGPIDGIAATRAIVERHPGTAVVVMSADGLDESMVCGCGALAFVRKQDLSPRRLRQLWADRP
jgi:DNA-binding NarL/FixJ family response regulator